VIHGSGSARCKTWVRQSLQSAGKLLVTFLDIQGILLQFPNGGAAVNAYFYCTALQHLKETIQMKMTLISYLLELNMCVTEIDVLIALGIVLRNKDLSSITIKLIK
jgi:hypothetical protein